MDKNELNMEAFGKIMDDFIHDHALGLVVKKAAGADDWEVNGAGMGPVMDLYIFLNALLPIFMQLVKFAGPSMDYAELLDDVLELVREGILEEMHGGDK